MEGKRECQRHRWNQILKAGVLYFFILGAVACQKNSMPSIAAPVVSDASPSPNPSATASPSPSVTPSPSGTPLTTNCLDPLAPGTPACPEIALNGTDPYYGGATGSQWHGYADATIRTASDGTLWMAYSYLYNETTPSPSPARFKSIETHYVKSTDGGQTWGYQGVLYPGYGTTNPADSTSAWVNHEVVNLRPQVYNGSLYWWGINSEYLTEAGGGQQPSTKRWSFAVAPAAGDSGPSGLTDAVPTYYGHGITDGINFPFTQNLSNPDGNFGNGELTNCTEWFEPALVISNGTLYLFLQCNGQATVPNYFYAQFSMPADPVSFASGTRQWTYVQQGAKKFADFSDAANIASRFFAGEIGNNIPYITQMDIAPSKVNPQVMLAIFSIAYNNANGKNSAGCVAAELQSVSRPKFVYDSQGNVQVDAWWTSTDSTNTGPGSCTYDPDSATGLIMAHKLFDSPNSYDPAGFWTDLTETKLFP